MSKADVKELLAKIKRQAPEKKKESPAVASTAPPQKKGKRGSGAQFWLHDEERRLIRELYAWLANQGERPKDSSVVRAALRMAKPGGEFLDAYRDAVRLDGRLRPRS